MNFAKLSALSLAVFSLVASAFSQSAYAPRFHTINAGIVVITSNGFAHPTPHVWNNLDQNTLVKPASWNFENPAAPSGPTADVLSRWPSASGSIRKDNAPYWEVNLANITDAQLAEYNVLLLSDYSTLNLTGYESTRLRRFMDNGGVLWVDVASSTVADAYNSLPVPIQVSTSSGNRVADFLSPLMNRPFNLSMGDIRSTEFNGDTGAFGVPTPVNFANLAGRVSPVVLDGSLATVGVSRVGAGYLVVTTRGVATVLNEGINPSTLQVDTANNNYQAENVSLNRNSIAAAKLIINAISLNSGYSQSGQGSRANSSSLSDLGAPLLPSFSLGASDGATAATRPPVFYKGLMVITTADTIYVYSAKPGTALDGSGATDYGLTDYSLGTSKDLIWKSQTLNSPISAATCAEVAGAPANSLPKDQILVVDGAGNLLGFDAFQLSASGQIRTNASLIATPPVPAYTITPASGASNRTQATMPAPPTFHEGVVYVADSQAGTGSAGRVWMADPSTGHQCASTTGSFQIGGNTAQVFDEFSAGPTVGYVPVQDNSGAMDKVAYVPAYQVPGGSGPTSTAAVYSFWIGVKGETYQIGTATDNAVVDLPNHFLEVPLRAYTQGLDVYTPSSLTDPLGVHVALTFPNGTPWPASEVASFLDSTSNIQDKQNGNNLGIPISRDLTAAEAGSTIRVDYSIDWGFGATAATSILRGVLFLPDDTTHHRNILGNIALTPSGNIVAVLSSGAPPLVDPTSSTAMAQKGGSVYNFTEKGRGIFKLNYRFEAYDSHTIQTNQGSSIHYPEAFTDNDAQLDGSLANGSPDANGVLPNAIKNLTYTSPPTVRDGVVYVTATGWKNTSAASTADWVPVSVITALRENPDPVVIYTGDLAVNFQIVQPDVTSSDDKSNPTHFAVLQPNQYTYVKEPGQSVGTLTLSNLMDRDNGSIGNALSTNQPLLLRQAGAPDQILEPNQTPGANWNPMLWYAVFPGYNLGGASLVTGDTLYSAGSSVLPGLLNHISGLSSTRVASAVAFNVSINSNDASSFVSDSRRSWMSQAHVFGGGVSSIASSNLLAPANITDIASVGTRVAQDALLNSAVATHLTGGDGVLAVTGDGGLYAFDSSSIMVADASRVGRYSASGDTLWSSESTLASSTIRDIGGGSLVRGLITPVRAYPFKNDTLIVDAGANRIIRMAETGREVRSIDTVKLDPDGPRVDSTTYPSTSGFRPDGYASGEPIKFNRPSDVSAFAEYVTVSDDRLKRLVQPIASILSWPNYCEYWVHYLVADTANHRMVDVIDRYLADKNSGEIGDPILATETVNGTPQSVAQLGILFWHSPSTFTGKGWDYNSVTRTQILDSSSVPHDVFAAGVGSSATSLADLGVGKRRGTWASGTSYVAGDIVVSPSNGQTYICSADAPSSSVDPSSDAAHFALYTSGEGTGNGSIVLFGYGPPIVINAMNVSASAGGVFWDPVAGAFNPSATVGRTLKLGNIKSVTLTRTANGLPRVMFTDSSGVYELASNGSTWDVQWMLPASVYTAMRGVNAPYGGSGQPAGPGAPSGNPGGLFATYARRLDEDHVLLVNGLVSGDFKGEIVIVSGTLDPSNTNSVAGFGFNKTNLGFGTNSIRYQLKDVRGSRAIQGPVFADRR